MSQASQLFEQDWDQTLTGLEQALCNDPLDGAACRRLADTYAIRGRLKDTVTTYLRLTDILKKSGDLESALHISNLILQLQPDSVEARLDRLAVFEHRRDKEQTIRAYRELARLYVELGRGEDAIALLKTGLRSLPQELDIAMELAETSVSQGHIREGLQHFSQVAHAHLEGGQPEKASQAFRRMKVIAPEDAYVLLTLGRLYVELGRPLEAEQEFRAILRQDLSHQEALLCLGEVCQRKGQSRDAMLAYNRLLSLNPQHLTARERMGQLFQFQGMPVEAIAHYTEAAQAYLELGQIDQAVRLHRVVLGLDPSHPAAIRELINLGAPLVPMVAELPSPQAGELDAQEEPPPIRDSGRLKEHLIKRPELKPLLPGAGETRQPALKPTLSKPILRRPAAEPVATEEQPAPPCEIQLDAWLDELASPAAWEQSEVNEQPIFLQSLVGSTPEPTEDPLELLDFADLDLQSLAPLSGSCSWLEESEAQPEETRPEVVLRDGTWNSITLPEDTRVHPLRDGWWLIEAHSILGRPQACLDLNQQSHPEELGLVQRLQLDYAQLDLAHQMELCSRTLEENPDHLLLRVHLAQLHLQAGLTQEAVALYREALSRHPGRVGLHHQYLHALIWNEEYTKAATAGLELAGLHRRLGQGQDAVDVLQLLLSLDPTHYEARQMLVDLLIELGERLIGLHHLRQLAEHATADGRWQEAARAWQRLEDEESGPFTTERLGFVAEMQGQNQTAWAHYEQLLHYFQGQQMWHEAASLCDRMLSLQPHKLHIQSLQIDFLKIILDTLPNHFASLRKLVEIQLNSRAYEEAAEGVARLTPLYLERRDLSGLLEVHEKLLAMRPDNACLRRELIGFYQIAEEQAQAVRHCRVLLNSNQATANDRYCLGELYYQQQELDPAIECFQKSRRQPELALKSYNMLGLCFAAKDGCFMQELAIKQLRKGLQLPTQQAADRLELRYNLGILLYRGRRLPEAANEFRAAEALRPGYRDVRNWVDKVEQEIAL